MKRSKKLVALVGVLCAACVATFSVTKYEEQKEIIKNSDEIILELAADTVTELSWKYKDESLAFHKIDETWIYDDDEAFPVNEEKIQELLGIFESFGVSFIIEDVEDYAQYGLDDPMCTINLKAGENSYEIQLGNYSTMDSKRYVSLGDGMVYLVNEDPFETFELTIRDMIKHDELPEFEQVTEIQFAGAENYQIVYEEDSKNTYCEDDVYFTEQGANMLPMDTKRVESYLDDISKLGLKEYVSYNVTEEELERYGLDEPELTVTVQYSEKTDEEAAGKKKAGNGTETEDTFVLHISRDPKEAAKAKENVAKAEQENTGAESKGSLAGNTDTTAAGDEVITAYARVGESQIVYELGAKQYKSLIAASYNDLRHQEVLSADFADINQIDIRLEDTDYVITTDGDADERTYLYGDEKLEIDELETALMALKADRFTDEAPPTKEEISLTLHLDNENYPEISIGLYRYDGSYCLATVDGASVSLVERSQVVDLVEAVYAIVLKAVSN